MDFQITGEDEVRRKGNSGVKGAAPPSGGKRNMLLWSWFSAINWGTAGPLPGFALQIISVSEAFPIIKPWEGATLLFRVRTSGTRGRFAGTGSLPEPCLLSRTGQTTDTLFGCLPRDRLLHAVHAGVRKGGGFLRKHGPPHAVTCLLLRAFI